MIGGTTLPQGCEAAAHQGGGRVEPEAGGAPWIVDRRQHREIFRRHEIGLSFVDVDEDVFKILSRISTQHRARAAV